MFVGIQCEIIPPSATARGPLITINSMVSSTCGEDAADIMSEDNFYKVLKSHVNDSYMPISKAANERSLQPLLRSEKGKQVNSELLAKHWG